MNVAIRKPGSEAEALMRQVLREGRPIAADYPLVFGPSAPGRVIALENDEGEVLSTCAILERELIFGDERARVGLIGSVATAEAHRGRGHGTEILASCEAAFAGVGCVCTLLWADEPEYYIRRGYVPIGTELDYLIDPDVVGFFPTPDGVREVRTTDFPHLHELYSRHAERVERSAQDSEELLATPGMLTLVREREGRIVAYACRGRGEDLGNVVHEWAGESEDVLALVRAHAERKSANEDPMIFLMAPPSARVLTRFLELAGVHGARGVLGMAKLVDENAAADLMRPFVEGGEVEPYQADGVPALRFTGPAGATELVGPEVLLALFAPKSERAVIEVVETQTGLALKGLPLAPFVWGLDSI